jgi:hypothetical protein
MKPKKIPFESNSQIRKEKVDSELRFSFKLFDTTDPEFNPADFRKNYIHTLMQRLKDLSMWTVKEFTGSRHQSIRNHPHDWSGTSRPRGFQHLNEQLRAYQGWQFQLSSNEHGRVHGIIIDNTFYVIWLDQDHKLYPKS